MPFLSGDLWTVLRQGLGDELDDAAVAAFLDPLPLGLGAVSELKPTVERAKKALRVVADPLPCTTAKVDAGSFEEASCEAYPYALSLRLTGRRAASLSNVTLRWHYSTRRPGGWALGLLEALDLSALAAKWPAEVLAPGAPIGPTGQGQLGTAEHRVEINPGCTKCLGCGQRRSQRRGFLRRHAGDVDLGPQGFAERRLHRQPTQAQGVHRPGGQCDHGSRQRRQCKARNPQRTILQGNSPQASVRLTPVRPLSAP